MDYASKSAANVGIGTGIAGLSLGVLNSGLLGNVFGGGAAAQQNYVTKDMLALQMQLVDTQKDLAIKTADLDSEKKMVETFNASINRTNAVRDELSQRIREVEAKVDANAAAQSVINCQANSNLNLLNSQVGQLFSLTQLKVANSSVCPGWGPVTITPGTGGTTTA